MGVTDNLEKIVEKFIDKISETFSGGRIQPIEIAKKAIKELKRNQKVGVSQTYVPNVYYVILNPEDLSDISAYSEAILPEIKSYLMEYIKESDFSLLGPLEIELISNNEIEKYKFDVRSSVKKGKVEENLDKTIVRKQSVLPYIWIDVKEGPEKGKTFTLVEGINFIGRKSEGQIKISDPEISRTHVAIHLQSQGAFVEDMGSTNGTYLNDKLISEKVKLKDGDLLSLGDTVLEFRQTGETE